MMKKGLFFLIVVIIVLFYGNGGGAGLEEGNGAKSKGKDFSGGFCFPEYSFDAVIEDARRVSSRLEIKYTNNNDQPLDSLKIILPANVLYGEEYIRINLLEVRNRAYTVQRDDQGAAVVFASPLEPGAYAEIRIDFETVLPRQPDKFGYYNNSIRLSNWYPVIAPWDQEKQEWVRFEHLSFGDPYFFQAAIFKGRIKIPAFWKAISPFTLGVDCDSGQTVVFDSSLPARDCTFIAGTGLKEVKQRVGDTTIEYWFQGKDRGFAALAGHVLDYFTQVLGDYPYSRLVIVDLPLENLMGMEFSGLIMLSSSCSNVGPKTVAHEIAHQYWYGTVGSDQINEPWLDEGLANYCALLYLENRYGAGAYRKEIERVDKENGIISYLPVAAYPNKQSYKAAVYVRTALFWNGVRNLGGKEKLFQVLRKVQSSFHDKIISGEDLFGIVKEEYGLNNTQLRCLLF